MRKLLLILALALFVGEAQAQWPGYIQSPKGGAGGAADTATALAADPDDCAANNFAHTIAASGALTCSTIPMAGLNATGTPDGTTFLRGDGAWSTPAGSGDVVGPASSVDNAITRFSGTTGKLVQDYTSNAPVCGDTGVCTFVAPVLGTPTSVNLANGTALPLTGLAAGATEGSLIHNLSGTWTENANCTLNADGDLSCTTITGGNLIEPGTVTNGGLCSYNSTGPAVDCDNFRKGYLQLTHPDLVDGTGCAINTTATAIGYGRATCSNSADQAANYMEWYIRVPDDIDTAVALRGSVKFTLGGADTATHRYVVSTVSVADSAVPTSATLANAINLDFAGDAGGASGDVETVGLTTLTGWAAALTAGQTWRVRLARDGNATEDASTVNTGAVLNVTIEYGKTQ